MQIVQDLSITKRKLKGGRGKEKTVKCAKRKGEPGISMVADTLFPDCI